MKLNTVDDVVASYREYNGVEPSEPTTLSQLAYDEIERVCNEYEVPITPHMVGVMEFDSWNINRPMVLADACPLGCGRYEAHHGKWTVEKKPRGYLIGIYPTLTEQPVAEIRSVVRHEIAHIVNWHIYRYTVEQRGIHAEWLDRLDSC